MHTKASNYVFGKATKRVHNHTSLIACTKKFTMQIHIKPQILILCKREKNFLPQAGHFAPVLLFFDYLSTHPVIQC